MAMCSVCGFAFCVACKKTYHGTDDCWAKEQTENDSQAHVDLPQSKGTQLCMCVCVYA